MPDARTLGKLVLQEDWSIKGAVALIEHPTDISLAIDEYEMAHRSLMEIEPALNPQVEGSFAAELRKWLKPIGMANWPEVNWDRGEWLSATMLALSDLPPKVAISAARQAIHRDFRFPNEVKPAIREIATGIIERQRLALHRLKLMRAEIERAANPPVPQIEEQPKVWTEEEVAHSNAMFRRLGISTRWRYIGNGEIENATADEMGDIDTGQDQADMGGDTIGKAPDQ